jgi:hypothetical protein
MLRDFVSCVAATIHARAATASSAGFGVPVVIAEKTTDIGVVAGQRRCIANPRRVDFAAYTACVTGSNCGNTLGLTVSRERRSADTPVADSHRMLASRDPLD